MIITCQTAIHVGGEELLIHFVRLGKVPSHVEAVNAAAVAEMRWRCRIIFFPPSWMLMGSCSSLASAASLQTYSCNVCTAAGVINCFNCTYKRKTRGCYNGLSIKPEMDIPLYLAILYQYSQKWLIWTFLSQKSGFRQLSQLKQLTQLELAQLASQLSFFQHSDNNFVHTRKK